MILNKTKRHLIQEGYTQKPLIRVKKLSKFAFSEIFWERKYFELASTTTFGSAPVIMENHKINVASAYVACSLAG